MTLTYFLRDMSTLEHLITAVVPHVLDISKIRFWDGRCIMGQEQYNLILYKKV